MATIKDLKKEQKVFVTRMKSNDVLDKEIIEAKVVAVGRVYVSVVWDGFPGERKYQKDETTDRFREHIDYGWKSDLFLTRQEAEDFIEKKQLVQWALKRLTPSKIFQLNLKELRGIRLLLDDELV